ncbi:WXG100 family type VII secretion target [Acetobacterium wieringae]|uniref:WXG100 family type VII secretion target n=1 Tax=Acetobacterium wieringae TaxID=52694 RepID=UPI003159394B
MSRAITVQPTVLKKTADSLNQSVAEYEKIYKQLFSEVDGMGAAWQGIDNQAFVNQIKGFMDDFQTMSNLMKNYSQFLTESANTYEAAQNEIVSSAKRLTN